jgi:Flp pilus assembly protein TadD
MKIRQYAQAEAEWRRAVGMNPAEAPAHNNLGFCLAELGRAQEAIEEYQKALQLSPDYPEAHNNLGSALMAQGRPDDAIPRFRRALELKPEYGSAHSNLGIALSNQNRIAEAIEHFRAGAELTPESADARNNLGVSLAMTGQWPAAVPELEMAVKLSGGKEPMMLDLLGLAYAHTRQFPKAAAAARRGATAAESRGQVRLAQDLLRKAAEYDAGRTDQK